MDTLNIQVSTKDVDLLGGWKTNERVNKDGLLYRYARNSYGTICKEFLHRLVAQRMLQEEGKELTLKVRVKFRDGIKTNCTRGNLVLSDHATVARTAIRIKGKTSKYRGVYKDRGRWHAKVYYQVPNESPNAKNKVKYKVEHLGFYPLDQEEEAGRAVVKRLRELYPEVVLNFPDEKGVTV